MAAKPNKLAMGIIGNGDITETNAFALLDDKLEAVEEFSGLYTKTRVLRNQKGLRTTLGWFEEVEAQVERTDVVLTELARHANKGDDVVLLVVGTEGIEDDIAEAHKLGITVKDLTAAYDDVLPEEKDDAPASEGSYGPDDTVRSEPFTPLEVRALKRLAQAVMVIAGDEEPPFDGYTVNHQERETKGKKPEAPREVTKQRPGTKPYFVTEDGDIRKAVGRKRTTETKVFLTETEAEEYVEANS